LLHGLGRVGSLLGNRAQAIADLELCLEMSRRIFGPRHQNVGHTLFALGIALNDDGRLDEAGAMYAEALDVYREVYGDRSGPVAMTTGTIGTLLSDRKDYAGAEAKYLEAIELWRDLGPQGAAELANAFRNLGEARRLDKRYEEAESALLESRRLYAELFGEDHPRTVGLIDYLVLLYEDWGKPETAAEWQRRRPASEPEGG
jgi:tetratricopeptide (TPR) repeat protein